MQNESKERLDEQIREQEIIQQIKEAETTSKQFMTKEAIARYGNLKLTHPELAIRAILIISKAIKTGQLRQRIDDETFKSMLKQIQEPKQNFRIIK